MQICLAYCSVQIFNILFRGLYSQKSDPPDKIIRYALITQHSWILHFYLILKMICTSRVPVPERHLGGGQPSNIFARFIGAGGINIIRDLK